MWRTEPDAPARNTAVPRWRAGLRFCDIAHGHLVGPDIMPCFLRQRLFDELGGVLQQFAQFARVGGFDQMVRKAGFPRALAIGLAPECGEGNKDRLLQFGLLSQALRHLEPVEPLHAQLGEYDMGPISRRKIYRLQTGGRNPDIISPQTQQQPQAFCGVGIIIDHEHPERRRSIQLGVWSIEADTAHGTSPLYAGCGTTSVNKEEPNP